MPTPGTLYVVATPLGNLEDLSFRAVRILREVHLIAAEDTRTTRKLLTHYDLHTPLRALHGDSREREVATLVRLLEEGQSVAYVSEAGTPAVSDPGAELVQATRAAQVPVVPIPGPGAPATAFSVAGFSAAGFIFAGYPPRQDKARHEFLERYTNQELPLILFESPQRVLALLKVLADLVPERQVIIARELSKQFEQIVAGPAAEAPSALSEDQLRGEFTLVIAGADKPPAVTMTSEEDLTKAVRLLREGGVPRKTIAQVLQLLTPLSRNEAYRKAGE